MIVVDASAIVEALVAATPPPELLLRLSSESLHAPHLLDVEVLSAIRRLVARRTIPQRRAETALADFAELAIARYPHPPLRRRVWALRRDLSAYDATYVALAEEFAASLITVDGRLGRSGGHRATIEAF